MGIKKALDLRALCVFATAILILLTTSTPSQNPSIYCIIGIYNIIDISILSGLGNIHFIVLFVLIYIINIYSPWTNRGHCPHSFAMDILLYLSINNKYTNIFYLSWIL